MKSPTGTLRASPRYGYGYPALHPTPTSPLTGAIPMPVCQPMPTMGACGRDTSGFITWKAGPGQPRIPVHMEMIYRESIPPPSYHRAMAGASYSLRSAAKQWISGNYCGESNAKEGTYTIWANTPSNPTDWKDFLAVEYNNDSNYNLRFQADNASPSHC